MTISTSRDVVSLTRDLVRINSGPDNLVAGENAVADTVELFATENGLEIERFETVRGRPMLIVTLPGQDPSLGTVGFVHHSDVVAADGEWKLGEPFSGDIATDAHGREVLVGRGSLDTKGPAAQVLMAMKRLKDEGRVPERSVQLFLFPDEETGGREGAWHLAKVQPERFANVRYWVVEGSGLLSPEVLGIKGLDQPAPYLAVAQKYSTPMQLVLKSPEAPGEAIEKTTEALARLDDYIADRDWSFLGDEAETKESFRRMGDLVGGFSGWLLRKFWWTGFVQDRMGPSVSAANRTDMSRTDFYLSNNPEGSTDAPNVKPSSATAVIALDLPEDKRERALSLVKKAAGEKFDIEPVETTDGSFLLSVTLPEENYDGTHHGSMPDRERDAVDVTNRALERIESKLWWRGWAEKMKVVDYFTSKSPREPAWGTEPVRSHVTLDLRLAVDDQRETILRELQETVGDDFELRFIGGPEELDAHVRRLSHQSELFQAAEGAIAETYGADTPVLFGNTTASNDVRYLMEVSPNSEALTFVPVLFTENGAHGPDEAVTTDSLRSGVDWTVSFLERLAPSSSGKN